MPLNSYNFNSTVCFFPDGVTNGDVYDKKNPYVPCEPDAPHSACCNHGETCVGNGLCLSGTGMLYRGACTDSTWKDPSCPKVCSGNAVVNTIDYGHPGGSEILRLCPSREWVCGDRNNCTTGLTFPLEDVGGVKAVKVGFTGNATTTGTGSDPASTAPGSCSDSSSPGAAAAANNNSEKALVVGASLGIPLGIALLLALAWGFWERRKRTRVEAGVAAVGVEHYAHGGKSVAAHFGKSPASTPVYEMPVPKEANELAGS